MFLERPVGKAELAIVGTDEHVATWRMIGLNVNFIHFHIRIHCSCPTPILFQKQGFYYQIFISASSCHEASERSRAEGARREP